MKNDLSPARRTAWRPVKPGAIHPRGNPYLVHLFVGLVFIALACLMCLGGIMAFDALMR